MIHWPGELLPLATTELPEGSQRLAVYKRLRAQTGGGDSQRTSSLVDSLQFHHTLVYSG